MVLKIWVGIRVACNIGDRSCGVKFPAFLCDLGFESCEFEFLYKNYCAFSNKYHIFLLCDA